MRWSNLASFNLYLQKVFGFNYCSYFSTCSTELTRESSLLSLCNHHNSFCVPHEHGDLQRECVLHIFLRIFCNIFVSPSFTCFLCSWHNLHQWISFRRPDHCIWRWCFLNSAFSDQVLLITTIEACGTNSSLHEL